MTISSDIRSAAIAAYRAGLSLVPVKSDGTKEPLVKWGRYQQEQPPAELLRSWFDQQPEGFCVICGCNDVEALEIDEPSTYQAFVDTADAAGLGELIERLTAGYFERSPGMGYHWLYRCNAVGRNEKLAERPDPTEEHPNQRKALIETRGRGGYIIVAPSGGGVHPSGDSYTLISGGFEQIATITPAERDALFELARGFDEVEKANWEPRRRTASETAEPRPGDDYDAHGPDWSEILTGWTFVSRRGDVEFWRRPGKDRGTSATINAPGVGPDRLYVWSTSTSFEAGRSYSKFQAHCVLEHGGDFSAAAASLARQGYGESRDNAQFIFTNGQRDEPVTKTRRADYPLTDTGNAERLVDQFGERIRFVVEHDRWIVYDGKRWAPDQTRQLERMAKTVARDLHNEAVDVRDAKLAKVVSTFARRSESTAGKRNMIISAQAEPGIVLDHNILDAQAHYLNTQSGTVDLQTGKVQAFRRLDYLSKITSSSYDARAECPTWLAFLERIFDGDQALIRYIQRAVGYSFTGSTSEQVLFIMWGDGANGKSTFLNALMLIAGPYGRNTPAETLYERRQDAIPNDLAALEGARLVAASESDDRRTLSEGRIKQMTGGDRIPARFMRAEWFEFTPQFKVWLATNHKPEIKGTDHAIWRRLRLIPFTVRIPEEERDNELGKKLEAEAGGILRWIVDGARAWYRTGLEPTPEAVLTATEDYQAESDYVGMWLNERCEVLPEAQTRTSLLYEDFVDWSRRHGRSAGSQTRFGRELSAREGLVKRKSDGVMVMDGVRFKAPATFALGDKS
jgi:putative DNA primase/helicase